MTDYDFEKLKEKHKDVLESPAVQIITNWRDPLYNPDQNFSEEEYLQKAKDNLQKMEEKGFLEKCLAPINNPFKNKNNF